MSRVGFGYFLPNGPESPDQRASFVADCDRNLEAISGHFTSAWMADHLQFGSHDMLECWTSLAYFAGKHPQLQFAHGVLCQSFRNPALAAKMGATFQLLTGGRLIFGIGAGWHEEEYKAYNYPFPSPGTRLGEMDEAVQITKLLWTQEETTFEGQHYQVHGARCEPRPDPLPPIVIGGRRPRILRVTARYADWWDVSGFGVKRQDYPAIAADMDEAVKEVGRDNATLRRSFSAACGISHDPEKLAAFGQERSLQDGRGFLGTPEEIIAQLRQFVDELNVTHFQLAFSDFPNTDGVELFIKEVLPVFAND